MRATNYKAAAEDVRTLLTQALSDANACGFYVAQSDKLAEGDSRAAYLRAAVAARRRMDESLQRVIDAVRGLANEEQRC
jgi:hypothetical protein